MQAPPIPADEDQRLAALGHLDLLDTPAEERFDRITRLAAAFFKVPIALVSLVGGDRQWFKSRQGLDACETPRGISFCGHAILSADILYVPDALEDPRFADNPLVTGPPHIRSYAGAPLVTPGGHRVGTLCIIDRVPRELVGEDLKRLRDLADCVQDALGLLTVKEAAQTVQDQETRLRAILAAVIDGIILIDEKGAIQKANPAAERLFRYTSEEMVGRNVRMLMPEPHASRHDGYIRHYLDTGEARIIGKGQEVEGRRKDGSRFPMDLAVSQMRMGGARYFVGVTRDITARKLAEKELQRATALRQAILDSANASIISTDVDGVIRTFNKGAERMLGYSAQELVDKATPAVIHDKDEVVRRAGELSEELGRVVEPGFEVFVAKANEGVADEQEWTYVRKDGGRFPVRLSVTPLRDHAGAITGFLGIGTDLSERKKVERMKSEFVSTVSHELRTPLTSIRGALGLVLGGAAGEVPEKAHRMLVMADRNSERLTRLINHILDLEKIESDRIELELQPLDLSAVARDARHANQGYADRHGVGLFLEGAGQTAMIRADEHRLHQVFSNLISNAVKFSPKGGDVEVSLGRREEGFRVAVRDRGPGIPEEFRPLLFQRFAQADSSDTRQKGGTGLGLSITKAILERLGGRIGYETELGEGTVFFFDLPEWHEVTVGAGSEQEAPRALVCEDNPDVAQVLCAMLAREGVACDLAGTAKAALELLSRGDYRVMLLDLSLPDVDGLTLLRDLRGRATGRQIPVIVVSGRADEGRGELDGDAVTVVDWIQKPVDQARLSRALSQAMVAGGRPRVLHVEDDPDVVQVVDAVLRPVADSTYAATLAQAQQRLAEEQFDLVILDLTLPDGSGLDLLDRIKGRCPVVIFSGLEPSPEISRAVAAALTKSTTSNEKLLETIRRVVFRSERSRS